MPCQWMVWTRLLGLTVPWKSLALRQPQRRARQLPAELVGLEAPHFVLGAVREGQLPVEEVEFLGDVRRLRKLSLRGALVGLVGGEVHLAPEQLMGICSGGRRSGRRRRCPGQHPVRDQPAGIQAAPRGLGRLRVAVHRIFPVHVSRVPDSIHHVRGTAD
jgi:hypothetical protein